MKQALSTHSKVVAVATAAIAASCIFIGCKGGKIPGSSSAAPHLEERNALGVYTPYYVTAQMNSPRYYHQAIRMKGGLILVTGGSDEKGYTAFDTAEIYDETTTKKGEVKPPSGAGVWYDTDFEGNTMVMGFRRLWHTMTTLPDNRVILIGGSSNFLKAEPVEKVEIFDPETRTFETLTDSKLALPVVRHTSVFLRDGTILITGGQIHDFFTDIQQNTASGIGQSTTVTVQTNTDIFPSTNKAQVFTYRDMTFSELTYPDSSKSSTLSSARGRAGHACVDFAGPDNKLGGLDDLYILVGGFQTPSAPDLVPRDKFMRAQNETALRTIEVFDPSLHVFSQVGTLSLREPRVNDPQATNLGVFNEVTPDGVTGLGNVILVCNGDDNTACFNTTAESEVISANFTGFGPAQGLQFYLIAYPAGGTESGHLQQMEAILQLDVNSQLFQGRAQTNIVPLVREMESIPPGEMVLGTWVFNGYGVSTICTPGGPAPYYEACIASGVLFDPFYKLLDAAEFTLSPPPNARDLTLSRIDVQNPTGIFGTWFSLDGDLPNTDRIGYGDTPLGEWAHNNVNRCFPKLISLAGEDGIINTIDDRVLACGGGQDHQSGGEATQPSAEVVLIPNPMK
jgi:hypothetical protein